MIVVVNAYHVRIPLRRRIRHASQIRKETDNLPFRCVWRRQRNDFVFSVRMI